MIENQEQLAVVSRQLADLKAWRERVLVEGRGDAFQRELEAAGIEKMIARLQEEVAGYEATGAVAGPMTAARQA